MTSDLPPVVKNYLDMHGYTVLSPEEKREYDYTRWAVKTMRRDAVTGMLLSTLRHSLHPRNLAVELNPLTHLKRRRFRQHLDEHRCHERGGFGRCETAMRLFDEMHPKDKVLIG